MGLIDDKKSIFTDIGAYNSLKEASELSSPINSFSSINNKNEIIPFFLDLLTTLIGSKGLSTLVGELLTNIFDSVGPKLKEELLKQSINSKSSSTLSSEFINNGYNIPIKQIDSRNKLKNDPNSDLGSLLYDSSGNSFDNSVYNAIVNEGTDISFNNIIINYNETLDQINIKPQQSSSVFDFNSNYINGITLLSKKEFISNVMNSIFGTISSNQNKTENQIIEDLKINNTLQKIIDEQEDLDITSVELNNIISRAKDIKKGVEVIDLGCGLLENKLTVDNLNTLVNNITDNTDPLSVGNEIESSINGGYDSNERRSAAENNDTTIKDGFLKRIINIIINEFLYAIGLTPQILTLFIIINSEKNNGTLTIDNPLDHIKNNKNIISCLSKKIKQIINEFIFNLIKEELLKLLIPIGKTILKEKINQYIGILKSLVGL